VLKVTWQKLLTENKIKSEADELLKIASEFYIDVLSWIKAKHPSLLP
jgi:hypothetical protein